MYSACITRLHTATLQRYTSYIVDYTCIVYMYSAFAQGLNLPTVLYKFTGDTTFGIISLVFGAEVNVSQYYEEENPKAVQCKGMQCIEKGNVTFV